MKVLLQYRWLLFGILLIGVVAVTPGLKQAAEVDNALTVWFLETDPQLETYNEFQDQFGNDEVILFHLENESSVFEADFLVGLESLVAEMEAIDGIHRVHSILSAQDAWDEGGALVFRSLVPSPVPRDESELEEAARRTTSNPILRDRLVNAEGTQTMLWLEMAVMGDIDARRDGIIEEVRQVASSRLGAEGYAIGGIGVIYSGLNVATERDFGLFLGLAYLMMLLLMWWIFRNVKIVVATLGVITVGIIVALGAYGLMGHQLNMVTVVIPVLVMVLGLADAVHFPTHYVQMRRKNRELKPEQVVTKTLSHVLLPALLTTLTTMGSFLALASSPMAVIRNLGIYSALGIGAAFLATVVLMTLILSTLPEDYEPPDHPYLRRFLEGVRNFVSLRKAESLGILALIMMLSLVGASRIEVDTYTIGYLADDDPVVVDHHRIEKSWGAYSLLEFVLRPKEGLTMESPEVINASERFVLLAEEEPLVRGGFGIADIYRRTAAVFLGELEELPDRRESFSPEQIDQLGLLLSMQRLEWDRERPAYGDNFMARVMTEEGELGRITLTADMVSAGELKALFSRLELLGEEVFDEIGTFEAAGYPPLYTRIIDYVMTSKIRGFFLALLIIFLLLLIGLRSFRLALISLPANVFPVVVMLGAMGFFGITLDIATAMVGAIVIGIAIDDSVHFLYHWKRAEEEGLDWDGALAHTYRHAGMAALITTIILVGGFPVLMLASVKTVVYVGLLTTIAAFAALLADLVLLPAMLRAWPARKGAS